MSYDAFREQYPTIRVAYERLRLDGRRSMILIDELNGLEEEVFLKDDEQSDQVSANLLQAGRILVSRRSGR